ncbi:hypothetical protein AB0D10_42955 [Kitasatospora sp. NPDC048545]|uniref:hypothetical protein n=1 Tax=Kitasatospora sp. NPDC048545 TaxID=3157208 RepID=UPI0033C040DF
MSTASNETYQDGGNPAAQFSLWEAAGGAFRTIAGLKPPLDALAARLRLSVQRSREQLGEVDAALSTIDRRHFALGPVPYGQSETWGGCTRRVACGATAEEGLRPWGAA